MIPLRKNSKNEEISNFERKKETENFREKIKETEKFREKIDWKEWKSPQIERRKKEELMQEHAQTLTERNDFSGFTNPYLRSWNKIKKRTIFNEDEEKNDDLKKDDCVTFRTANLLKQNSNNVKMNFFVFFFKNFIGRKKNSKNFRNLEKNLK